ncbi:hypothetical protein [Nocardia sp. NPDC047648]|uniref:hypothetical protein n=1 Tax=Nocardia sp. NPDC047648 TaxID=3155625 RepID=UPI0033CFAAF4
MGVLTDYFRAADAASVVQALERADGGPLIGVRHPAFDGVDAKGVDPMVALGQFVAVIRGVPWQVELVKETAVWPTTPAPGPDGPEDDDDPWVKGPWVTQLDTAVRDILAAVHDQDVSKLVAEWVKAEELHGARVEYMQPVAQELIELARRARAAEEQLYCWMCL